MGCLVGWRKEFSGGSRKEVASPVEEILCETIMNSEREVEHLQHSEHSVRRNILGPYFIVSVISHSK